jgi:hypothetical protein
MTARSARVAAGANSAVTTEASVRFPGFPCRRGDFGSAPIARRSETFWYDSAWFPDVGAIAPRAGGSIRFPRFCRIDPRPFARLWGALPCAWEPVRAIFRNTGTWGGQLGVAITFEAGEDIGAASGPTSQGDVITLLPLDPCPAVLAELEDGIHASGLLSALEELRCKRQATRPLSIGTGEIAFAIAFPSRQIGSSDHYQPVAPPTAGLLSNLQLVCISHSASAGCAVQYGTSRAGILARLRAIFGSRWSPASARLRSVMSTR